MAPPVAGQQPGVIVEEREQIRLAQLNSYAVQRISNPKVIRVLGLEPAEHRRRSCGRGGGEAESVEVALQGAFIRGPAQLGAQDPLDRRGGALGGLPAPR